ncbi:hypothetical protein H2202_000842 [Exophiala xenobiotica]|nr:hypothetical protein H2202_000842 [Exophiala xenobiotica]
MSSASMPITKPYRKVERTRNAPCQVSCAALNASIDYHITNDTSTVRPGEEFCNVGTFDSTTINRCAFCYSFIPQQLFLANFLQALHISCVQPPIAGKPFFPDAAAIFNETLIAGPAPASNNSGSGSGLHGWKLAVAIALPIVGGILLFGSTCWCCFHFTRKRRQRMAQAGRMSRIHDANADGMYSPVSAKGVEVWGHGQPPTEMHAISPTHLQAPAKHPSPVMAQGRWSHLQSQLAEGSDQGTPLRNSFQREDVGPGTGQVQDPNLHEQYFGVDDDPDADAYHGVSGPSDGQHQYHQPQAVGVAHGQPHVPQVHVQDYERGHFI